MAGTLPAVQDHAVAEARAAEGAEGFRGSVGPLPGRVRRRMVGSSWRPGCPVPPRRLVLVELRHRGFDGRNHHGRLVVHRSVGRAVLRVFRRVYAAGFPIRRMRLVDRYGGRDARSMRRDNTSAFNCRRISGGGAWSRHAYGTAVDVNPVENPYVRGSTVLPRRGARFRDRSPRRRGMIGRRGPVTRAFAAAGWSWGGAWRSPKDYQHFSAGGG
ncbi:MAG: M15 family metallopeptidase [Actinobacteria bacterium]|nr:M15 family metallopeptidase [Actinomycetota bacterium]